MIDEQQFDLGREVFEQIHHSVTSCAQHLEEVSDENLAAAHYYAQHQLILWGRWVRVRRWVLAEMKRRNLPIVPQVTADTLFA